MRWVLDFSGSTVTGACPLEDLDRLTISNSLSAIFVAISRIEGNRTSQEVTSEANQKQ
jgi:hypothetical protein